MGTQEELPTQLPLGLTPLQQDGYKCFLSVMQWHGRAGKPTNLEFSILRPSDIIVTSVPKSGNTLLQQICYQIAVATGGASASDPTGADFSDFNEVSPWLEYMSEAGVHPFDSTPRVFKSHMPLSMFPTPLVARHIVVVRDPLDFPSTFLDFLFDAVVPGAQDIGADVREAAFDAATQGILLYVADESKTDLSSWHAHTRKNITIPDDNQQNVLVLCYEDVLSDLKQAVRRVAKFMQCDLSEEGLRTVVKRCDRNYMASRPVFGMISEAKIFQTPGMVSMKAKVARTDGFKQFKVRGQFIQPIREMNKKAFGFADYDDLRKSINEKMYQIHGL